MNNHTVSISSEFIKAFNNDTLNKFNFEKCKINLFDYRKLVDMLVAYDSNKYIPLNKVEPYDFRRDVREFLKKVY